MKFRVLSLASLLIAVGLYAYKEDTEPGKKFIETTYFDSTVKPGDNFFEFVNGRWLKTAVIPPTETSLGSFLDLYNRTKDHLKSILDSVSTNPQVKGSIEQKVGDFYASGMDSVTIEKLGYNPIKPYLQQVDALTDAKSIMRFQVQRQKEGFSYVAGMYVGADEKNSNMNIANFYQTGLGLPDRDYYIKTDAATDAIQKAYKAYMKKAFVLTGDDSIAAGKKVDLVYALEKQIAESHRTRVELRDPQSNYNKMAVSQLNKQMPVFGWSAFLNDLGAKTDSVNVSQPAYYAKINTLLSSIPVSTWKAYLRFHVINDAASYLSSDFVNAKFNYSRVLSGQQQIKPRWERMYAATDANLGEPLGQLYVKKYFTADARRRMMELVNNLEKSFDNHITNLDWMSAETKVKAKEKLYAFMKKIGYPDKWRDYSKVAIDRNRFFENIIACSKNDYQYQLSKLNKPVDKTEWGMTPPTINAYYNPTFNEIVFPAGILQFPFFDPEADDAINYGGIGMVIGHEMTHGFDDQGAQYDKEGNLRNWWQKEDSAKFVTKKSRSVIDLYNSFTVLDTLHVNGSLTTGENMADIGGIAIAYDAFKMTKQGQGTTKIDGFTPDQRFFISLAQIWRTKQKDQTTRLRINTDPHSPAMYRVNGPLQNFTPFYAAFNVKPGDKMYLPEDKRIKIW